MIRFTRRLLLAWVLTLAWLPGPASSAQEFPNRPVRLVAAFAPGGSVDLVARVVKLSGARVD